MLHPSGSVAVTATCAHDATVLKLNKNTTRDKKLQGFCGDVSDVEVACGVQYSSS